MGIAALAGVTGSGTPPAGDQANAVVSGTLTAVGPGRAFAFWGPMNVEVWASVNTALTTTLGSGTGNVVSGTGLAIGGAINSLLVPPGTTWKTFSGTSGTFALPIVTLFGYLDNQEASVRGLATTSWLLGATVTGPGIPAATTVTAISQAASAGQPQTYALPPPPVSTAITTGGIILLSNTPTIEPAFGPPAQTQLEFALAVNAIAAGVDTAAIFTGASTTFSGTIQVERSFDGGATWLPANIGGAGTLAQYNAGTPVSLSFGEPERAVLYRVNCIAYTSGTINYRMSATGQASTTLSVSTL